MGNSKMHEPRKRAEFPFAVLLVFLFVFSVAASVHAAGKKADKPVEKKETKESVVLMPLRPTKDIPQDEMTQYEAAIVQSLSEKYVVYSGQKVLEKVNAVYKKRSGEATAGKECDETKCLQDVAMEFQTALVAVANIRKSGGGYSVSLSINDVTEDKSVFSAQKSCKGCDEFGVADVLATIVGGSTAPQSKAAVSAPTPAKSALSSGSTPAGMAAIPAGEFWMGSSDADLDWVGKNWTLNDAVKKIISAEQPRHRVRLNGFFMDKYLVTNKQFEEFVRQTGHKTDAEKGGSAYVFTDKWEDIKGAYWRSPMGPGSNYDGGDYPVVQVSWNDADAYCKGVGKRLPTEAEWEYAAKGGHDWRYPWGDEKPGNNQANFADVSSGLEHADKNVNDGYKRLSPVGNYPANGYGLFDMAGNAVEWVADWFDENYYKQSPEDNPKGPSNGSTRVLRGGSWFNNARNLRAAIRGSGGPVDRSSGIGFRCSQY